MAAAAEGLLHDLEHYENFLNIFNQHQQQVVERVNRKDPFQVYNEAEFRYRYRFSKQTTLELIDILSPTLARHTTRRDALPVHLQVLTALRFYAVGEFETFSIVSEVWYMRLILRFLCTNNDILKLPTMLPF